MAAQLIQRFPPGMVAPLPSAEEVARAIPVASDIAVLEARRQGLIRELAALRTRSHRRAALQARLNEVTRRLLELTTTARGDHA